MFQRESFMDGTQVAMRGHRTINAIANVTADRPTETKLR
jgi:hypothetical protein